MAIEQTSCLVRAVCDRRDLSITTVRISSAVALSTVARERFDVALKPVGLPPRSWSYRRSAPAPGAALPMVVAVFVELGIMRPLREHGSGKPPAPLAGYSVGLSSETKTGFWSLNQRRNLSPSLKQGKNTLRWI